MRSRVILSVLGSDRPGLTQAMAEAVYASGGNWLESHLSHLGGKYVGAVLVELDAGAVPDLERAVAAVDAVGLHVSVVPAGEAAPGDRVSLLLELVGQDRPGIVREVTTVLSGLQVNIEDFETETQPGSWSGEPIFKATGTLALPDAVSTEQLRAALEAISGEFMVDFTISA